MLEPVRSEAELPDRAVCLTTFSHFLIVNKTSLSHTHTNTRLYHQYPPPKMSAWEYHPQNLLSEMSLICEDSVSDDWITVFSSVRVSSHRGE